MRSFRLSTGWGAARAAEAVVASILARGCGESTSACRPATVGSFRTGAGGDAGAPCFSNRAMRSLIPICFERFKSHASVSGPVVLHAATCTHGELELTATAAHLPCIKLQCPLHCRLRVRHLQEVRKQTWTDSPATASGRPSSRTQCATAPASTTSAPTLVSGPRRGPVLALALGLVEQLRRSQRFDLSSSPAPPLRGKITFWQTFSLGRLGSCKPA